MRRALSMAGVLVVVVASVTIAAARPAAADPSASNWAALRQCESSGDYSTNTGNGYYGAYQFDQSTWDSVGGAGLPSDASPAEQDYRALYLYRMRGWSPWTCATLAGLVEDSSAGSGAVPDRAEAAYISSGGAGVFMPVTSSSCNVGAAPPTWGGEVLTQGHTYRALVCWQKQMDHLGFAFTGTGYFGNHTLSVVHQLQLQFGIAPSDVIDAQTWAAAWGGQSTASPPPAPAAPTPVATTGPGWPGNTAASCHVGATTAPTWPKRVFTQGSYDRDLGCWQMQMGSRGFNLTGTGYFGVHTLTALHQLQAQYGITRGDTVDAATWAAGWIGEPTSLKPTPGPVAPSVALWAGNTAANCHVGANAAPAWPGKWFTQGSYDRDLGCWQMQMGRRGYHLFGSGYYGTNTLAAAKDIQNRNHLGETGLIGENTWNAAWSSR